MSLSLYRSFLTFIAHKKSDTTNIAITVTMPKIDILDANEKMNEQSSSSPLSSFYLPSERSINTSHLYEAQGWKVQTEVKKSNIPGAGFGR